ncbi:MAG: hypothetical protein DRG78_09420 [Epsilonproteobacteria bacterium]|nr:MAG: hypothetical protein DRG78_09420 [Campylobacterota bacterium]
MDTVDIVSKLGKVATSRKLNLIFDGDKKLYNITNKNNEIISNIDLSNNNFIKVLKNNNSKIFKLDKNKDNIYEIFDNIFKFVRESYADNILNLVGGLS